MLFMLLQKWDFPSTCLSIFYNIRISNVISNFSLLFSMSFYHEFISKDLNNLGLFLCFSVAIFFKSILMFPNYLSPPFPEEKTNRPCHSAGLSSGFSGGPISGPSASMKVSGLCFPLPSAFLPFFKKQKEIRFSFFHIRNLGLSQRS